MCGGQGNKKNSLKDYFWSQITLYFLKPIQLINTKLSQVKIYQFIHSQSHNCKIFAII